MTSIQFQHWFHINWTWSIEHDLQARHFRFSLGEAIAPLPIRFSNTKKMKKMSNFFFLAPILMNFFFWCVSEHSDKKRGRVPTKNMQTSPPPEMDRFLWKVRNLLKRMQREIKFISRFLFSWKFSLKFIENWGDLSIKMTITRKTKIGKLIFLSIQHIPHLSCIFDNFLKKYILMHV